MHQILPRRRIAAATATVAILALLAGGCSGGDGSPASPAATSTTTQPAVATTAPAPTVPPSGTDKEYASQLCGSLNTYLDAFIKETTKNPDLLSNEARLLKVAAPILANLGTDLARANPPADVKQYHDELVTKVKDVAQQANDGTITTLAEISDITSGVAEPPAEVQARLQAAAADVKECQQSLLSGSLFGG